jgi:hypothetical protein
MASVQQGVLGFFSCRMQELKIVRTVPQEANEGRGFKPYRELGPL